MDATTLGITTLNIMTLSIKGQFTMCRWNVAGANLVEFFKPYRWNYAILVERFFENNNQDNAALNKIEKDWSMYNKTFCKHNWFFIIVSQYFVTLSHLTP